MRFFQNIPLGRKLSILIIVFVFIALVISSAFIFLQTYSSFESVVEENSKEINKQIILNYEAHFEEVSSLVRYLEIETEKEEIDFDSLEELYTTLTSLNGDIGIISLVNDSGIIKASSRQTYVKVTNVLEQSWYEKASSDSNVIFFTKQDEPALFQFAETNVILVSKEVTYHHEGEEVNGVLLVEMNLSTIETLSKQSNLGENGHLIIFSEDNNLIYSSNPTCYDETCTSSEEAGDIIVGSKFLTLGEDEMFMSVSTIHGTRWRIATFINSDIVTETRNDVALFLVYVVIGTIVASTLVASILSRQVTRPLEELKEHMMKIEHSGHLYEKVHVSGQKEVVILADAFNDMISEIRRLLDQLVTEQKEKRKTEFIALQTQINPHFLYNTLDSIVWLSEKQDHENVIEMVVALSRFFRISISKGRNIITIEKEIQHANYYLQIQKIRYANKFDYEFDVDESILNEKTVKLILQPLIENAINHGIQSDFKGFIKIRVYQTDTDINFEVMNNGYGLTETQINDIYKMIQDDSHQSYGLKNVVQRLKLYFGEKAGLEITSVLDESSTFRLYFPKEEGEQS